MTIRRNITNSGLKAVDAGGDAGGAEAIVNVYDGNVRGAGIEHSEQSGDAAEAGTVTNAGGHGNYRDRDEAADDAGQSAFHAGNADDDASLRQLAFTMLKQAMNACDADVVKRIHAIAHHAGGEKGFLGDGDVAGACGNDEDQSFT